MKLNTEELTKEWEDDFYESAWGVNTLTLTHDEAERQSSAIPTRMKNTKDATSRRSLDGLVRLFSMRKEMRLAGISFRTQDEAKDDMGKLVLMVDLFCASIETGVFPTHGSHCHRLARALVKSSGMQPKRTRRRLPNGSGEGQREKGASDAN